jgi:hypothetical protein
LGNQIFLSGALGLAILGGSNLFWEIILGGEMFGGIMFCWLLDKLY